jgi:hypothetical protein
MAMAKQKGRREFLTTTVVVLAAAATVNPLSGFGMDTACEAAEISAWVPSEKNRLRASVDFARKVRRTRPCFDPRMKRSGSPLAQNGIAVVGVDHRVQQRQPTGTSGRRSTKFAMNSVSLSTLLGMPFRSDIRMSAADWPENSSSRYLANAH